MTLDCAVPAAEPVRDRASREAGALSGRVVINITANAADSPLVLVDVRVKEKGGQAHNLKVVGSNPTPATT